MVSDVCQPRSNWGILGEDMIDNYGKAMALVDKMKLHVPISAYPMPNLARLLQQKKINLPAEQLVQIQTVDYAGDEGGICCGIKIPTAAKEAVVVSLTHLRIPDPHPLGREISDYQKKRIRKLSQQS